MNTRRTNSSNPSGARPDSSRLNREAIRGNYSGSQDSRVTETEFQTEISKGKYDGGINDD